VIYTLISHKEYSKKARPPTSTFFRSTILTVLNRLKPLKTVNMVQVNGIVLETDLNSNSFNFLEKRPFNLRKNKHRELYSSDKFFIEIKEGSKNQATELYFSAELTEIGGLKERVQNLGVEHRQGKGFFVFEGPVPDLVHKIKVYQNDQNCEICENDETSKNDENPQNTTENTTTIDHLAFITKNDDFSHKTVTEFYQKVFNLNPEIDPITMKYNEFILDINLLHGETSYEQFVISRSLSTKEDQISKFLKRNGNKNALQHVAFRCAEKAIFEMVECLGGKNLEKSGESRESGVTGLEIALPPDEYYGTIKKYFTSETDLKWFEKAKNARLLIDKEDKLGGYLFQLFSKPILGDNTLFLEFIHRIDNTHGLGKRNVEALWRSLENQ